MIDESTPQRPTAGNGEITEALVAGLEERGIAGEDAAMAVCVVVESIVAAIQGLVLECTMMGLSTQSLVALGLPLVEDIDAWYASFKPEAAAA